MSQDVSWSYPLKIFSQAVVVSQKPKPIWYTGKWKHARQILKKTSNHRMSNVSPRDASKVMTFPFDLTVWILLCTTILVSPACLWIVARLECAAVGPGEEAEYPPKLKNALWYAYGTFLGENVVRKDALASAWASRCVSSSMKLRGFSAGSLKARGRHHFPLWKTCVCIFLNDFRGESFLTFCSRIFLGFWLLYSFVVTASYGGLLVASSLRPEFTRPVESMADVIESGLPWRYVRYYIDFWDEMFRQSRDPTVREFWEGKTFVEYDAFPYKQVSEI